MAGDFGGGSLYPALGVVSALLESRLSGRGQVVDAAMVDGSASLMTLFYGLFAAGYWSDERPGNRLDSGAPWYNVYETADGGWISLGANESRFWRNLLRIMGIDEAELPDQHDNSQWPAMRERFAAVYRTRTRDEWCALAAGQEACVTPVLSLTEAPRHRGTEAPSNPHLRARGTIVDVEGVVQPAPAPRFSRTPGAIQRPPAGHGEHTDEVLGGVGLQPSPLPAVANSARPQRFSWNSC
ncbi:CoA transferase [Nocardia neocaledoniensis]|uniref:CoA transferase n=1 Tax=Nocardia neocaledoniensis TaxID=236511 RepID=UPI0021BECDBE|nr:CaiB/BaiF CoA-transferase family protein [Nocardia neocaledoniensis]